MNLELITTRTNNKIYKDGDSILKVFNDGYSKQDVFYEALINCKVESTGISVPSIKEVTTIDGNYAYRMESFGGKCLADLIHEDPDNADKYLDILVKVQTDIHKNTYEQITTLRNQLKERINASSLEDYQKYDLLEVLDSAPKHKKLCHGNLNPTHIWLDGDKYYVLDWLHATQGNASADVARSYLWFMVYMPELADAYVTKFCELTKTTRRYVNQWIPIVAAARLTKGLAEEESILREWISKYDYQ